MFQFEEGEVDFAYPITPPAATAWPDKPGLTGNFKPDVEAPGVSGLYFCGDTYLGRGLAIEGLANRPCSASSASWDNL